MSPNLRIAFRFLTAKKRAMLMSLSCTILGVGLFIVTQATTSGFEEFFIRTILGTDGAMRIEDRIQDTMRSMAGSGGSGFQVRQSEGVKYIEGVDYPDQIAAAVKRFASVRGVSAVLRGNVQVTSSFKTEDAQVFGINLQDHLRVSDLGHQIVAGDLGKFGESPSAAVLGRVLADRLQLTVGDSFVVNAHGEARRYRVAAIYETGVRDIDKLRIYISLTEARSLLKKPTGATFIQINLDDPNRAPALAEQMQEVTRYKVTPWEEREKTWLAVFRALRISSAITVTVFTLIAGLAMFNTLAMIVLEKTKDIAILRSMGYERRDITQVFLWQAGIVLAIGSIVGALFGAGVTWCVGQMPLSITGIFKTDHFLVDARPEHFILAILTAIVMVMVASLIPARRAARLEPGDIIRGTAQ
jgi:lipoprotein-releasing system permease protein